MTRTLFVNLPFCSPVSPPYSLVYLAGFIQRNSDYSITVLDLNAELHKNQFPKHYEKVIESLGKNDLAAYSEQIKNVKKDFGDFSKTENFKARKNEASKGLDYCKKRILEQKPDVIIISLVYNSQAFFAHSLAEIFKELKIEVIIGGPATTNQLKKLATHLPHEVALLEHLAKKKFDMEKIDCRRILDYSLIDKDAYFNSELVIPLKTTSCCYYQRCAFCTHHQNGKYEEYDLEDIKESITRSKAKKVFLIDDMIHKKRLLDLAKILSPLNIEWICQLRPTIDLDEETFKTLNESGLKLVIWGVESGNDRVLKKMDKGTNVKDVEIVLKKSHLAGISNGVYIMFGFPTETKEEFLDTIRFLEENSENIDLISTAAFGLQEGSIVEASPDKFSVINVSKEVRERLPEKISYVAEIGLHTNDAKILRKKYSKTLGKINKYPKEMNMFREHMFVAVCK